MKRDSAKNERIRDTRVIQYMSNSQKFEQERDIREDEKQQEPKVSYKENQEVQCKWGKATKSV